MPKSLPPIRPLLALAFVAAFAVAGSGCGTGDADPERGRVLFVQKCGTCVGAERHLGPGELRDRRP